jgi:hypothetical protein
MAAFSFFHFLFLFTFVNLSTASPVQKRGPDDVFAQKALENVYKVLNGSLSDGSTHEGCTKEKLAVRKE